MLRLSCTAETLKALIGLLAALAQHHTRNGMSAIMLGQALGPLLFRPGQDDRALSSGDVGSWVDSAVRNSNNACPLAYHSSFASSVCQPIQECSEQTALARQDLSCTYLAHYELESVFIVIIIMPTQTCPSCST